MRIRFGGNGAYITLALAIALLAYTPVMASILVGHWVFVVGVPTFGGAVALVGAILMLRGATYVVFEDDQVVIHALIGPLKRRFPYTGFASIEDLGGKLYVVRDGQRRRLPIHRSQVNAADWQALIARIHERAAPSN